MEKHDDGSIEAPENYQAMLTPRPMPVVQKVVADFLDELYALRNKYGIANLTYVAQVFGINEETGQNGPMIVGGHIGDQMHREAMAAHALGLAQADRQVMIADMLREAGAITKPKKRG